MLSAHEDFFVVVPFFFFSLDTNASMWSESSTLYVSGSDDSKSDKDKSILGESHLTKAPEEYHHLTSGTNTSAKNDGAKGLGWGASIVQRAKSAFEGQSNCAEPANRDGGEGQRRRIGIPRDSCAPVFAKYNARRLCRESSSKSSSG